MSAITRAAEDRAYMAQAARREGRARGLIGGYKVGCTTAVMQEILGLEDPVFGRVMEADIHRHEAKFAHADFRRAGIECEIAVRLCADLPAAGAPYDRPRVEAAIGSCMAAIEVVDNRYGDFRSVPVAEMIADDFFQSACVIGSEVDEWKGLDMAAAEGRLFVDGELIGSGRGSQVLGHPLAAVVWIANRMASLGWDLPAGSIIMTGSLTPVHWLDPVAAEAVISIDGLGEVRASFN